MAAQRWFLHRSYEATPRQLEVLEWQQPGTTPFSHFARAFARPMLTLPPFYLQDFSLALSDCLRGKHPAAFSFFSCY